MLTALYGGRALGRPAELATESRAVTRADRQCRISRNWETAALLVQRKQGRHRYLRWPMTDVGALLETMMGACRPGEA